MTARTRKSCHAPQRPDILTGERRRACGFGEWDLG